jgi:hypothetical protein
MSASHAMASELTADFPALVRHLQHSVHTANGALVGLEALCNGLVGASDAVLEIAARRAAVEEGAVEAVLAALAAQPEHMGVQRLGSRALTALVWQAGGPYAEGVARATAGGAVTALLVALALSVRGAEPELATFALDALHLLQPEEGAALESACVAVAAALRAHAAHTETRQMAVSTLRNWLLISRHTWGQRSASAHAGALACALGDALRREHRSQTVLMALSALRWAHLRLFGIDEAGATHEEAHAAFVAAAVAADVPASLAVALRTHAHASAELADSAAGVLARLCRLNDAPAHKALFENALPPLVAALAAHTARVECARPALRALSRCIASVPRSALGALDAGMLPPLLAALRTHANDELVQQSGLLALDQLILAVGTTRPSIQGTHGTEFVRACAAAMRALPRSAVVQSAALSVVARMVEVDEGPCTTAHSAGIAPLAVAALMAHPRNALLALDASRCLNGMVTRLPAMRVTARRDGLLGAAVGALRTLATVQAPAPTAHACALVASLTGRTPARNAPTDNASLLAAAGVLPLIVQARVLACVSVLLHRRSVLCVSECAADPCGCALRVIAGAHRTPGVRGAAAPGVPRAALAVLDGAAGRRRDPRGGARRGRRRRRRARAAHAPNGCECAGGGCRRADDAGSACSAARAGRSDCVGWRSACCCAARGGARVGGCVEHAR